MRPGKMLWMDQSERLELLSLDELTDDVYSDLEYVHNYQWTRMSQSLQCLPLLVLEQFSWLQFELSIATPETVMVLYVRRT